MAGKKKGGVGGVGVESRPVGRPPGTSESIESIAKRDTQATLKLSERLRRTIEGQLDRIEGQLRKLSPDKPDDVKEILELTRFLVDVRELCMKSVRETAKIAQADPAKAMEGESDAAARELLAQLRGEG